MVATNSPSSSQRLEEIHHYCRQGLKSMVEKRLYPGQLNAKDAQGRTLVMICSEYYQPDILKYLLEMGAEVDAKNIWGETALMIAARKNNLQAIDLLVQKGANKDLVNDQGMNAYELALFYNKKESAQKLAPEIPSPLKEQFKSFVSNVFNLSKRNFPDQ